MPETPPETTLTVYDGAARVLEELRARVADLYRFTAHSPDCAERSAPGACGCGLELALLRVVELGCRAPLRAPRPAPAPADARAPELAAAALGGALGGFLGSMLRRPNPPIGNPPEASRASAPRALPAPAKKKTARAKKKNTRAQ